MTALTKREPQAVSRWYERGPLGALRHEMDDLFENFFGETGLWKSSAEMMPSIDLSETDETIQVETDLPGFKAEEVDIEINDNYLTISGSHSEEQQEEGEGRKYHRVERRSGRFSRSILLPCSVNQDAVQAELKDGVLSVTLPKAEEAKRRKITVKG